MSGYIYPFIIIYGFYIIVNGNLTPGGGFQGGAIIATGVLLMTFFSDIKIDLIALNRIEKLIFIGIIIFGFISYFTKKELFTNFLFEDKKNFLIALNMLIGFKVTLGLINILQAFLEEGDRFN